MLSNSIMRRITIREKKSAFKVAIIGAKSVGKSALTVRIKTRKFIHSYAPNTESKCSFTSTIDGELVNMEVLDTAALQTAENAKLEEKIKWADAFILMYSVTDMASLSALIASKCLINLYAKRRRKAALGTSSASDLLVAIVGNKSDMEHERAISEEDGRLFAEMHECPYFFELSTRESYDSVKTVFDNLYRTHITKLSKTASGSHLPRTSAPVDIPRKDVSENALMEAAKRRDRSRTTMINILPIDPGEYSLSPITHKKIYEETTVSSCSPDDEHRFIGEQIIFDQSDSPTSRARRITVCTAPSPLMSRKLSHPAKRKQRKSTETNDYDTNNNSGNQGLT